MTSINGVSATQTIMFSTPGNVGGTSHFNHLELASSGTGVMLMSPVFAQGLLQSPIVSVTVLGTGNALTVSGLDAEQLVFDNVPLVWNLDASNPIDFVKFDNAVFTNFPTEGVDQFTINHPGQPIAMVITNVGFTSLTGGNTGRYLVVNDIDGPSPFILTIQLNDPVGNGTGFTQLVNGAIVNWL